MIRPFILSPDANEGIRSAVLWYRQHDVNLPLRFEAELKAKLSRIAQYPYLFPRVTAVIRRALMRRFPYSIYFVLSADTVHLVAIVHQRRLNPLCRP